ncbi:phosphoglycerate mutase [Gordoniibacillus kamchatkensis]|uniref:Phosphoglycerate mutase n=1 Tax=Gordoniibacillus kamchatkensis TaxID=1590651 RepID=A0ABR5AG24_9BACL|nr:histidine phosphatase family protein [Paenibacillus sp. VKM B-2647]KIL40006.1 phosphoglycerate mutase [Paenibacillus sp. VKM B-2647]
MSGKTTIYIVRHGQTAWNVEHRFQGHQDSPLTELGTKQAEWLGESLRNERIDTIFSSSSPRARKTAELIRGARDLDIMESGALMEIHLGIWEGLTQTEVKQLYPEQLDYFWNDPGQFRVPGSETFQEVSRRAVDQLHRIIGENEDKSILIVTHTVVVKLLMAHFEDRPLNRIWNPPYIHPACLCKVEIGMNQPEIILHGDISHYKEAGSED